MREWSLQPGDPLALNLAADFRFCIPDYTNDHIWELETTIGDPVALCLHTTYGLRAQSMRIFPRFSQNDRTILDPASFAAPPTLHKFFPNYLSIGFSPFTGLQVEAECWVPDSHSLSGRFFVSNHLGTAASLLFEMCGQLIPRDGQTLACQLLRSVNVLVGHSADLAPVIFFTGGPTPGSGPFPSLAIDMVLAPGESRTLTWAEAALATPESSLELARKTAARPWEAERTKIEIQNTAQTFEIFTGELDWDTTFALTQKTAFSLFFRPGEHLPYPSFVINRQLDQGYSPRGDGSDHPYLWSGQSPLESYYLTSVLPGAPELAAGLVHNFLAVQNESGAVDWKPGMAGQRGRWLAAPLLASLAWQAFQHSGDMRFLEETLPKLEAFVRCWFDRSHDRDNDGFPEWDHPLQTGLESVPAFNIWSSGGQGAEISTAESPTLAAMLYREVSSLDNIAVELNRPPDVSGVKTDLISLATLVEDCWDSSAKLYHLRDRDTHQSPIGKLIGSRRGSGKLIYKKLFSLPVRLLIRIELTDETSRRIQANLQGMNGECPQVEKFDRIDFHWGTGLAVATTRKVYTCMTELIVSGLEKLDQVSVLIMDFTGEDISLFLPLWAGIPNQERAQNIVQGTLLAPDRFEKPFGIPAYAITEAARTESDCQYLPMAWNHLIGEGLLRYGMRKQAAHLLKRLMSAIIQNLKQQHAFYQSYNAETGAGVGERNSLHGLAPLGLFLSTLGVQIRSPRQVFLSGKNPFPWPVTVKYRGLMVTRQMDQTKIIFPDGRMITVDDPTDALVSTE